MNPPKILTEISHRPWQIPSSEWKYYQEWNNALFLHWEVPESILKSIIPAGLNIDLFDGKAYVSLVAFTMQKIRPRYLPSLSFVSDFHEINLRTYIDNDEKKGVYFISIEAQKAFSAFLSRTLSGLPYQKSNIVRDTNSHKSTHDPKGFSLHAEFDIKEKVKDKTSLDKWLTERYCLYVDNKALIHRYEIHHAEWEIKNVNLKSLSLKYKVGEMDLSDRKPDLVHYSDGVKVLAWGKEQIKK